MPVLPPGQSSPSQSPGGGTVPPGGITPADTGSLSQATGGDNASSSGGQGIAGVPFPMLALAAVVVAAGIWAADKVDSRAAWGLTLLVLLVVAFGYPNFGQELYSILGGSGTSTKLGAAGSVG